MPNPTNDLMIQSAQEYLSSGGLLNVNAMRPHAGVHVNALLRKDEWQEMDASLQQIVRPRLVGVQDLISRGLVKRLGGLGSIISGYEQLGDMEAASVDMDGATSTEEDKVDFAPVYIPIPVIHKGFRLNIRHLEASRRMGDSLDVTQAQTAGRKVSDAAEELLFNGTGAPNVGGNTIYGYTNHPKRITDTAANFGGGDFAAEGNGYKTINGMIDALQAKGFYGPYGFYISRTQYTQLRARHTDGSSKSQLNAILEAMTDVEFIKPSNSLADTNGILVQLTPDVIDVAVAQDMITLQWQAMGGMVEHFKVLTALAPRIKYDKNDACGVVHVTGA
ncbi:MAG: family 1 encapsulin nanocompartment shell protein [Anaerolineae bacterium]|nr:family 1 encapsulin nanocompartment shell protein [Anaerolineae bacterium]